MKPNFPTLFGASAGKTGPENHPYFNNLVALQCEISYAMDPLRNLTAFDYAKRAIQNWNFDKKFDPYLLYSRFEHEFGHLLLALSFVKIQKNPTPFEIGYNGNHMAERITLLIEEILNRHEPMKDFKFIKLFKKSYRLHSLKDDYNEEFAMETPLKEGETVFQRRRAYNFNDRYFNEYNREQDVKDGKIQRKYTEDMIADEDLQAIYDAVVPVATAIKAQFEKLTSEQARDRRDNYRFKSFLKCLKVREIHDCMMSGNAQYQFTIPDPAKFKASTPSP